MSVTAAGWLDGAEPSLVAPRGQELWKEFIFDENNGTAKRLCGFVARRR